MKDISKQIEVNYRSHQPYLELRYGPGIRAVIATAAELARGFYDDPHHRRMAELVPGGLLAEWGMGLDVLDKIAHVPAQPQYLSPAEAHFGLNLLCAVTLGRKTEILHLPELRQAVIAMAQIAPCKLPRIEHPAAIPWRKDADESTIWAYSQIREQHASGDAFLPMARAYLVLNELSKVGSIDSRIRDLIGHLQSVTEMLSFTLSGVILAEALDSDTKEGERP